MSDAPSDRCELTAAGLGAALAGVLLAVPLAASFASFESGLFMQAAAVILVLALVALLPKLVGTRASRAPRPRWLTLAMLAWTLAALWGAAIGLLVSNSPRYIASQFLSMLLLPLGAAAFARIGEFDGRRLLLGLTVAAVGVLGFLLIRAWQAGRIGAFATDRLRGARNESLADAGLLILALGFARWMRWGGWKSAVASLIGGFMILGGQSRGQWLAAGVVIVFSVATLGWRQRSRRRAAGIVALLAGFVLAALAVRRACDVTLPTVAEAHYAAPVEMVSEGDDVQILLETPVSGQAAEVRIVVVGERGARARMFVIGRDRAGRAQFRAWPAVAGRGESDEIRRVLPLPERTASLGVGAQALTGLWTLRSIAVSEIDGWGAAALRRICCPPVMVTVGGVERPPGFAGVVWIRLARLISALRRPLADETVRYRVAESHAVLSAWRSGGPFLRLVGHGLGARFRFKNPSWNAQDERIWHEEASYIHNFYLFLLFKLGIVGLLALAALGSMTVWYVHGATRRSEADWVQAAAAAAWIGYFIWGVASPEIIDFRIAPLLGALVAASSARSRVAP